MPEFTGANDLRTYARVLWRWKWLFLVFLIGAPVAAYLIQQSQTKEYKSSALVGVNTETVNPTLLGSSGGSFQTTNVQAVAQIVTTTPVAQAAAKLMTPPGNPSQIVGEVSASGDTTTNFLTISATDPSPTRAADIANSFARAIGLNRQISAINELNSAIRGIRAQIARLGSPDPGSPQAQTLTQLQSQLEQYRAAKTTQSSNAAILQSAVPSSTPTNQTRRTVELALLIGLLLGLGAVVLAENADRRLRTPDALEDMADVPLLATIPPSAFSSKLDTGPADEESFQMLRTALQYFNPGRERQTVVITSPGEKDGKTTVAVRLALAAARAGLRVVLVDADLRRAQVGLRLGIQGRDGLGAVLARARSVEDVLVSYPIDEPGARSLTVIPAGSPPANPAALIGSPEMGRVLEQLETNADMVVIDTPAALMVSDPLPVMGLASGVLLVARMNRSTRERIRRLEKMIRAAQGTMFGVVATGVSSGLGYQNYKSTYYASNGGNGGGRHSVGSTGEREGVAEPPVEEASAVGRPEPEGFGEGH
jgi:polysaccharide biosynthesis transport protein